MNILGVEDMPEGITRIPGSCPTGCGQTLETDGTQVTCCVCGMPPEIAVLAPRVGTIWEWEPLQSHARCLLRVTATKWEGDDCWVESEPMIRNVYYNPVPDAKRCWNTLARWIEAAILIAANE